MNVSYKDIFERIPEPPVWWNSMGVPRYKPFDPVDTDVYAHEAILVDAKCQLCSRPFVIGDYSRSPESKIRKVLEDAPDHLIIGDPPCHDCTGPGNSMQALAQRVLEFWERDIRNLGKWHRVPSLEIEIPQD